MTVRARAVAVVVVALAALAAACGVPEDDAVVTIPSDDVPFELASPAAEGATEPESSGNLTAVVYFVDTDEQRLAPVSRRVETRASVDARLNALLGDLSQDEIDAGLTTYIADGAALVAPPRLVENGVIVLDFNAAFTEGQASADHLIAVAQVVWTVTDIQGIRAVLFQREGETQRELTGEGEQVPRPLDRGDFLDLRPQEPTTTSGSTSTTAARGGG